MERRERDRDPAWWDRPERSHGQDAPDCPCTPANCDFQTEPETRTPSFPSISRVPTLDQRDGDAPLRGRDGANRLPPRPAMTVPPSAWGLSIMLLEAARQMALVGEPGRDRRVGDRLTFAHQTAGQFQASFRQIVARGDT